MRRRHVRFLQLGLQRRRTVLLSLVVIVLIKPLLDTVRKLVLLCVHVTQISIRLIIIATQLSVTTFFDVHVLPSVLIAGTRRRLLPLEVVNGWLAELGLWCIDNIIVVVIFVGCLRCLVLALLECLVLVLLERRGVRVCCH